MELPPTTNTAGPDRPLLAKWLNFTRDLTSPDSFIHFGFHFLIGAALQRRVWTGASHDPIFPNEMIVMVARSGVGKGRITSIVNTVLRHHKLPDRTKEEEKLLVEDKKDKVQKGIEIYNKMMVAQGQTPMETNVDSLAAQDDNDKKPLVIPVCADATTYESLTQTIAKATRHINFHDPTKPNGKGIYTHASSTFVLEEMGSLFTKDSSKIVNLLHQTFDCKNYNYKTKHHGEDIIFRSCVSLLGGATPEFMETVFKMGIVAQGFAGRTIFIFESKNRKDMMFPKELDKSQQEDYLDILAHIKKLSELFGWAKFTDEAWTFLEDWCQTKRLTRKNHNPKLDHYYERKNIHVMKMAIAIHFADSLEMTIGLADCVKALVVLEQAEKNMHYALQFDKANPLAKVSTRIELYLKEHHPEAIQFAELFLNFMDDIREAELEEILTGLEMLDRLDVGQINGKKLYKWKEKEVKS